MNSILEENRTELPPETGMDAPRGYPRAPRGGRRGAERLALTALILSALALTVACAALLLQLRAPETEPERESTAAEEPAEESEPSVIRFRNHTLPILEGVPVNEYTAEGFAADEAGYLRYGDAPLGVDVSVHQGEIDWERVADSGISFAMIRAGLRGYTKGGLMRDEQFERNITGALAAGLKVGVYFFSQAISVSEAEEEAEYLLDLIEGYDVTYPVVFDWETIGSASARTDGVTSAVVTDCARAFCKRVADAGYQPMVYFNADQGYLSYRLDELGGNLFWLAEYRDCPSFYYHFDFWQYTHRGSVAGIDGAVDLDLDLRGS